VSAERLRDSGKDTIAPASRTPKPARSLADVSHVEAVNEHVTLVISQVHVSRPARSAVAVIVMDDTRTVTPMMTGRMGGASTLESATGSDLRGQEFRSLIKFMATRLRTI